MEIILKYFPDLSAEQIMRFEKLGPLYMEWNEKINVISRKDVDGLYEKHILHSLSIAAAFSFEAGTRMLDIGTGGGFPGIPLAIFFPELRFHLVDSIAKKIKVVDAIVEAIGLNNITTEVSRVEDLKRNGGYDFTISRAVASLKELWQWSRPVLKKKTEEIMYAKARQPGSESWGPGLISMKGGQLDAEIKSSGTMPIKISLSGLFSEDYFKEKYLLYIPA